MSKLEYFGKAVANALVRTTRSERLTIPLRVQSYNINETEPDKSTVKGVHFFTNQEVEIGISSINPRKPTIEGFLKLEEGNDPKFDYSVPKNGVILFTDCVKKDDGTYQASWAKSAIRKNNQTLMKNYSTVRAVEQDGVRPPFIMFESYVPKLAKTVDLKHEQNLDKVIALLEDTLNPKYGVEGNRSLALMRLISPDLNDSVHTFTITALKNKQTNGSAHHCTGKEALENYTSKGIGKSILVDGAMHELLGADVTIEVIPGIAYYVGKTSAEDHFYTNDDIQKNNVNQDLLGKLKPKTIISEWNKMLNKVEFIKDDKQNQTKVRKPQVMEFYLTASQLEDKTKIVTAFNTETNNQPIYDFSTMPSEALTVLRSDATANKEHLQQPNPTPITHEAKKHEDEESIVRSEPVKDEPDNFEVELSEADFAELNEISASMKAGM
jgi:hypothetical protein